MNECCDWHAVCLSENEEYQGKSVYLSYCPECNTISVCENGIVTKVDGDEKEYYRKKYYDKINAVKSLIK